MDHSFQRPLENTASPAPAFIPYTVLPAAEAALEQQLGPKSKLQLPQQYQAGFVRALPWVAVLFLPLQLAGVSLVLGLSAFGGVGSTTRALLSAAVFVLDLIALPGLFKRSRRGWAFFTYALSLGALNNLLGASWFGLVISVALVWLAFQVKYRYA